jgi:hypothetical protein
MKFNEEGKMTLQHDHPTVKDLLDSLDENLKKIKPEDPVSAQALQGANQDFVRLWNLLGFPHCPGPGLKVFP